MLGQDQIGAPALGPGDGGAQRRRPSRRSVLRGAAGAGAAGVAATALSGLSAMTLASPVSSQRPAVPDGDDAHSPATVTAATAMAEQVVVHVRDAATGQIDVFRGASRIGLHDRDLAARLMRASKQSPRAL